MVKNTAVNAFRLTHFYRYKFPANLTNLEMNIDGFSNWQHGPYEWDYHLQSIRLQGTFNDDLKELLKSATNISNVRKTTDSSKFKSYFYIG